MLYNLGSTFAALTVGYALDRKHVFSVPVIGYLSLAAGLAYLGGMPIDLLGGAIAGFMLGAGVTAGQTLIYAFAPPCYPLPIRATGVGYVITAGRIGTMAGPFAAGLLLSSGMAVGQVLTILAPIALVTMAVALMIAQLVQAGRREAASEPIAAAALAAQ
jgi:AAHS family 3-hydroxyphenylpropionic acid transporter